MKLRELLNGLTILACSADLDGDIREVRYDSRAVEEGDLEKGCFLSGQVAAMVKKIQPAAEIVRDVIEGAEPILKGATKWVR